MVHEQRDGGERKRMKVESGNASLVSDSTHLSESESAISASVRETGDAITSTAGKAPGEESKETGSRNMKRKYEEVDVSAADAIPVGDRGVVSPAELSDFYAKYDEDIGFTLFHGFETQAAESVTFGASEEALASTISWPTETPEPAEPADTDRSSQTRYGIFTELDTIFELGVNSSLCQYHENSHDFDSFDSGAGFQLYPLVDQLADVSRRAPGRVRERERPSRYRPEVRQVEEQRGREEGNRFASTGLGRHMLDWTPIVEERIEGETRGVMPVLSGLVSWPTAGALDLGKPEDHSRILMSDGRSLASAKEQEMSSAASDGVSVGGRSASAATSGSASKFSAMKSLDGEKRSWLSRKIHPVTATEIPVKT